MRYGRRHRRFRFMAVVAISLLVAACGSRPPWEPDQHIVRSGETLYSIAFRYGKDPAAVARWNRLGSGSLIHPGQVILLSPPAGGATHRGNPLKPRRPDEWSMRAVDSSVMGSLLSSSITTPT